MKPLTIGARYQGRVNPAPSDLASAIGNAGVEVVSSPATIGFLENACQAVFWDALEEGEGSVGVGFSFQHLAAGNPGQPMDVEAELVAQDGNRLTFKAQARQGDLVIMDGEHQRFVIDMARFRSRRPEKIPQGPALTFWYDLHSPFAYLAAHRIGDIAQRHGSPLSWRPLQLPRLIEAIGGRQPLEENAAFLAWYKQDLQDWAEIAGLTVRYHPDFPLRNARALRVCLYADDEGQSESFVKRVMRAYWSEAADITDTELLGALAEECGLDAAAAIAAATDKAYKQRLEANTQEAIERGVFGVPTVDTGKKLYFGNDRLDLLDRHLMARAPR